MEDEPPKHWVRWDDVDKGPERRRKVLEECEKLREHMAARGIYPKGFLHGDVRKT